MYSKQFVPSSYHQSKVPRWNASAFCLPGPPILLFPLTVDQIAVNNGYPPAMDDSLSMAENHLAPEATVPGCGSRFF
ncbi:hypothetical protein [Endozoicomonas sp. ONNA2]|uniref:hypothetical protein n=1 Tax=Endozoicomonas sp. ONNA2 TaxID=2828741 RepID=UPI00214817CF|nr:hypothetical protein [Endozoicomonas sp. ONNA2]